MGQSSASIAQPWALTCCRTLGNSSVPGRESGSGFYPVLWNRNTDIWIWFATGQQRITGHLKLKTESCQYFIKIRLRSICIVDRKICFWLERLRSVLVKQQWMEKKAWQWESTRRNQARPWPTRYEERDHLRCQGILPFAKNHNPKWFLEVSV